METQLLSFASLPETDDSFILEVNPALCSHFGDQNSQQRSDPQLANISLREVIKSLQDSLIMGVPHLSL